ncbi:MAG TPA: N-acetyltransferase [Desulfatiglandales bacterium]|nr:N-acetyltransferase [Desulfatiglandales bacterium]
MATGQAESCENAAETALCTIRSFSLEDLKQILEIEREAFPKTGYPKDVILNYAKRLPDGFIVVETGEQIVGYMIFDQTGHVYSAAVRPSHRRKGFGRKLFLHASEQSYGKLCLEVRSKNTGAIGFYQRIGMRIVGRVEGYYHGDDALIMILDGLGAERRTGSGEIR